MSFASPPVSTARPLCWTGDHPAPNRLLAAQLEQACRRPVVSRGAWIPSRWHPVRRHLAYLRLALALLARRRSYAAILCIQQFIGLYLAYGAAVLRIPLPPLFLQPFIYVARQGLFGRLWRRFFEKALGHPDLRIAFCHARSEIEAYQKEFPAAAAKFQLLGVAVDPVAPAPAAAVPPYLFSAGSSCRDYATLLDAARRLPPGLPPVRIACKPGDVPAPPWPGNVQIHHELWNDAYLAALAQATLVIVPLQPQPVSAGQIVFLQAMSAGVPIVATHTEVSEEFLGEDSAWLVPPRDPAALAQAIQEALANPDLARRKTAAARARFQSRHAPEALYRQYAAAVAAQLP